MGETGLFNLALVYIRPLSFHPSSCLILFLTLILLFTGSSYDEGLDGPLLVLGDGGGARAKSQVTEAELAKLKTWKVAQEKKLTTSEQLRGELEK